MLRGADCSQKRFLRQKAFAFFKHSTGNTPAVKNKYARVHGLWQTPSCLGGVRGHRPSLISRKGFGSSFSTPRGNFAGGLGSGSALHLVSHRDRKSTRLNSSHLGISYA